MPESTTRSAFPTGPYLFRELWARAKGVDEPSLLGDDSRDIALLIGTRGKVDIDEEFRLADKLDGDRVGRDHVVSSTNAAELVAVLGRIQRMSERLFPGPVTFEYARDPEDPSHEYIVFDVFAHGEFRDYRELEFQWHDEIEAIVPSTFTEFRLCVHPRS